jgi:hypothetical protein
VIEACDVLAMDLMAPCPACIFATPATMLTAPDRSHAMPWGIERIEVELDALEQLMPELLKKFPEDMDFRAAFAAAAEPIEKNAGPEQQALVRGRLDRILGWWGLIPSDNDDEAGS